MSVYMWLLNHLSSAVFAVSVQVVRPSHAVSVSPPQLLLLLWLLVVVLREPGSL